MARQITEAEDVVEKFKEIIAETGFTILVSKGTVARTLEEARDLDEMQLNQMWWDWLDAEISGGTVCNSLAETDWEDYV